MIIEQSNSKKEVELSDWLSELEMFGPQLNIIRFHPTFDKDTRTTWKKKDHSEWEEGPLWRRENVEHKRNEGEGRTVVHKVVLRPIIKTSILNEIEVPDKNKRLDQYYQY